MRSGGRSETALARGLLPSRDLPLIIPRESAVTALSDAPVVRQPREIHARRTLPPVPEGPEVADPAPSPPHALGAPLPAAAALAADPEAVSDELTLVRNTPIATAGGPQRFASNVGEPSVASRRNTVFYTGNWYAALSVDGGNTFRFIDPANTFPDPPGMGFCCDQVVQYLPRLDAFVWLLQYSENNAGENVQRLAFARTADVPGGTWKLVDISSQQLGLPGVWLDFPDLAVGTNMLYVTTNCFRGDNWVASALVRLPLAGIRALLDGTGTPTAQQTISDRNASFRVAQHCTTRAFWAAHETTSTLRLFTWPENAAQPSFQDVAVATWKGGAYQSQTPEGFNWLDRCDPRLVGATRRAGNELWFAWGANRGGVNNRPQPYVQIARLRVGGNTATLLDNVNLWDPDLATSYVALATNSRDEVGASYFVGGAAKHPSHVVGILTGTQKFAITAEGIHGPSNGQWGDYLTVRRHYGTTQRLFSATGYTLDRGTGRQDGNPRFLLFGRARDIT